MGVRNRFSSWGHTDVVPVQRDRWTQNPFGAAIVDGFIWGRGTLDDNPLGGPSL